MKQKVVTLKYDITMIFDKINISEIKTGYGGAVSTNTLLPRIIQFAQKVEDVNFAMYNHFFTFQRYSETLLGLTEADKPGIVPGMFEPQYVKDDKYTSILCLVPKFEIKEKELIEFMLKKMYKARYDFKNLALYQPVKFASMFLLKKLGYKNNKYLWVGPKKDDENFYICGEWLCDCMNISMPNLFPNPERYAPVDILVQAAFQTDLFDIKIIK